MGARREQGDASRVAQGDVGRAGRRGVGKAARARRSQGAARPEQGAARADNTAQAREGTQDMPDDEIYDPSSDLGDDGVFEDEGVLDASDTLEGDPEDDPLDTGIAPPDRWSAGEGYGTTQTEERRGESLDQLLAEEEPDVDPYADEDRRPVTNTDEESPDEDAEATLLYTPDPRSGRLVAEDEGAHSDEETDLVARDVGIDAGAAGAEEAAVHVVDKDAAEGSGR